MNAPLEKHHGEYSSGKHKISIADKLAEIAIWLQFKTLKHEAVHSRVSEKVISGKGHPLAGWIDDWDPANKTNYGGYSSIQHMDEPLAFYQDLFTLESLMNAKDVSEADKKQMRTLFNSAHKNTFRFANDQVFMANTALSTIEDDSMPFGQKYSSVKVREDATTFKGTKVIVAEVILADQGVSLYFPLVKSTGINDPQNQKLLEGEIEAMREASQKILSQLQAKFPERTKDRESHDNTSALLANIFGLKNGKGEVNRIEGMLKRATRAVDTSTFNWEDPFADEHPKDP